jgi:predicted membrane protein
MKKSDLLRTLNIVLIFYLAIWIYYAIFNWEVFAINLNTNAGFAVIGGYPFVFFFLLGLVILLVIKYITYMCMLNVDKRERNNAHKIEIMGKDIELLKMKEVLFKMQTSEMGKTSADLNALHEKLDHLSTQMKKDTAVEHGDEDEEIKKDG